MAWASMGLALETGIFVLAGWAWFRSQGYTCAEAGAAAIVSVFMALSLIQQVCLFIGSAWPAWILETLALPAGLAWAVHRRAQLQQELTTLRQLVRQAPFAAVTVAAAWSVMAARVVATWHSAGPTAAAVPLPETLTLAAVGPVAPLNAAALFSRPALFGLGPDGCGFGLLAYAAVGFSTYALARRYAWPPMALTVTIMVLSMPRLVYLAQRPSAELVLTAAIALALVLIYRLVEQHRGRDLRLCLLAILFCIDANPISIALAAVMALLLAVVVVRRHGWLLCWEMIAAKPLVGLLTVLPAAMLAQIPVFVVNRVYGHALPGVPAVADGLRGAAANLIRFLLASLDPTAPLQHLLVWMVELDLNRLIMAVYHALMLLLSGPAGTQAPFDPTLTGSGPAGFGPLAPLLVLAAMVQALVRGPRRLKAVSVAWAGYLYLAALVVAWQPDSLTALTPLYAANGFMVAYFLPPWRLRRRGMRLLQAAFALLLVWSLAGWPSIAPGATLRY